MNFYLYCDRLSDSARLLSLSLKVRRLREGSSFNIPATVINWGHTNVGLSGRERFKILNAPEAVLKASDKLRFFQAMDGTKLTVPYCTALKTAQEWIENGHAVVARTILNSHSGNGIVLASELSALVNCHLYTKYIKKENEWRVHVFNGEVIDVQRKARNLTVPDDQVNWHVRSHANGFIYMRGDLDAFKPDLLARISDSAINTCSTLALDFGAVDIITTKGGKVYVLEVNTAPGLEGTTLANYVNAIKKVMT